MENARATSRSKVRHRSILLSTDMFDSLRLAGSDYHLLRFVLVYVLF